VETIGPGLLSSIPEQAGLTVVALKELL